MNNQNNSYQEAPSTVEQLTVSSVLFSMVQIELGDTTFPTLLSEISRNFIKLRPYLGKNKFDYGSIDKLHELISNLNIANVIREFLHLNVAINFSPESQAKCLKWILIFYVRQRQVIIDYTMNRLLKDKISDNFINLSIIASIFKYDEKDFRDFHEDEINKLKYLISIILETEELPESIKENVETLIARVSNIPIGTASEFGTYLPRTKNIDDDVKLLSRINSIEITGDEELKMILNRFKVALNNELKLFAENADLIDLTGRLANLKCQLKKHKDKTEATFQEIISQSELSLSDVDSLREYWRLMKEKNLANQEVLSYSRSMAGSALGMSEFMARKRRANENMRYLESCISQIDEKDQQVKVLFEYIFETHRDIYGLSIGELLEDELRIASSIKTSYEKLVSLYNYPSVLFPLYFKLNTLSKFKVTSDEYTLRAISYLIFPVADSEEQSAYDIILRSGGDISVLKGYLDPVIDLEPKWVELFLTTLEDLIDTSVSAN